MDSGYIKHTLDPLRIGPRVLRSSRLLAMVNTMSVSDSLCKRRSAISLVIEMLTHIEAVREVDFECV